MSNNVIPGLSCCSYRDSILRKRTVYVYWPVGTRLWLSQLAWHVPRTELAIAITDCMNEVLLSHPIEYEPTGQYCWWEQVHWTVWHVYLHAVTLQ